MAARIGLQNSATKQPFFFHYFFFFVLIHKRLRQSLFYLIDQRHKVVKSEIIELETRIYDLSACIQDNRNTFVFSVFFALSPFRSLVFHFLYPSSPSFSLFLWPSHHCLSLSPLPFCRYVYVFFFGGGVITMFHFQSLSAKKIYKLHKK